MSGTDVYVGGDFSQVCGNATCDNDNLTVNYVAQWNGSAWSALGSGMDNYVNALAVSGSDVYIGGDFTHLCGSTACDSGNVTANHVAHWNGSSWSAFGSGVSGAVYALAVSGSDVYVGGGFLYVCGDLCLIGNLRVNYVARWNGSAWFALGSGVNNNVHALAVNGSDVYVGGDFIQTCGNYLCTSGNITVNGLARWNTNSWSTLGSGVSGAVYALAVSGNNVYVGGQFTQVCGNYLCSSGNATVYNIALWDGNAWSALGVGVDSSVNAIALSGSDVYVGGFFNLVCGSTACGSGNVTVNHVVHWNGNTWVTLGSGVNDYVDAIAVSGNDVYVGGSFTQICGNPLCNSGNSTVWVVAKYTGAPVINIFLPIIER